MKVHWLTPRETALILGMTVREVYAAIDRAELPAYKIGKDIKLLRSDVDAYRRRSFGT